MSGWRGIWTPARARLWLVAGVVAAYLPVVGMPFRGWLDFSAFYAAGSLAFTAALPRLDAIVAFQRDHGLPITPFVYPSAVALPYAPLSALPYGVAAALHVGLMLGVLVLAARLGADLLGLPRRWVILGALAWGPAAAGVVSGQNTSIALFLAVLAAKAMVDRRQVMAGALVGILAYKPQLAAPLIGLGALRGWWRGSVAVVIAVAVWYALGVVATGGNTAWYRDWFDTLSSYSAADFRENGWQAISLPALGTRLELVTGIPWLTLVGYVGGGLIVLACIPQMRCLPTVDSIALACACGLVVSPHAWVYDATLLLPALGVLAARANRRAWPWRDRWLFAAMFMVGLTWPLGGVVGLTLVPVLVVAIPLLLRQAVAGDPQPAAGGATTGRATAVGSLPFGQ
ncbi:MAG: glycosyltransferase family 87 protein [Candidatus Limnocylindrales bacterium]